MHAWICLARLCRLLRRRRKSAQSARQMTPSDAWPAIGRAGLNAEFTIYLRLATAARV
jgi:hypothetical protein